MFRNEGEHRRHFTGKWQQIAKGIENWLKNDGRLIIIFFFFSKIYVSYLWCKSKPILDKIQLLFPPAPVVNSNTKRLHDSNIA